MTLIHHVNVSLGYQTKYALLDLMLQYRGANKDSLSDVDIRDEVNTFMFAVSICNYS